MPTIQGYPATLPERKVADVLNSLSIAYEFQTPFLGGRTQAGGVIADFYIYEYSLIISVLGEYWHSDPRRNAQDLMQRTALASTGVTTIFIDEADIMRDASYYVKAALMGMDLSKNG